jgi:tetratricopeptide (TPR) repeat protein
VSLVQIRQSGPPTDGAWPVVVSFPEFGSEYELVVSAPGGAADEQQLGWYFEQHLRYPFLDHGRRDRAAAWVGEYGRLLFTMVFGGDAYLDYRRMRDGGFDGCTVAVVGDSGFQGLHWETLQDPYGGAPLAVRVPFTRKVTAQPKKFDLPGPWGQIRVLAVTARPNGAGDVGYRTISQPLLDSVRTAKVPVSVDFVRPGTWEAFRARLRDSSQLYGTGCYQVVHFDVHGAFTDAATLAAMVTAGDLAPVKGGGFAGQAGFVFFETATDGVAQAVPAREVAEVLAEHRVPVVVLNACQSAMQVGSQASLAQELVTAGVPVAIGMAYSVTVTAARKAMPVLYGSLGQGSDPVTAARAMRQVLRDDPTRNGYFNQDVDLADWMLPVVYSQRPVTLGVREMTTEEQVRYYDREATVGAGPLPEFGFHGRDLDIHRIERAMLLPNGSNQLLVHGMAGAGKSTLLAHLGWWWARTGLVENIFRYSWEDRAWTLEQIIRDIATTLLTPQARARFEAMSTPAQTAQIAVLLRATRHLLILDNAESITATPASIPHALTPAQQGDLAGFLQQLSGGQTLVVVGSRQDEAWLASGTFGPHTYLLPGLDEEAASELVDAILTRHHADRWLTDPAQRAAIGKLTTLLGGYPLPLTVVMPILASTPPAQVLADLQAGQVGADPAGMITTAIEYSNAKLEPTMQISLLLLAPFTATIHRGGLLTSYQRLLAADPAVTALGDLDLAGAVAEAVRVGLATPHRQITGMVQVQPVLPYFLRAKLRGQPEVLRAAVQAHYQAYADFAGWVHGRLTAMEADQRHLGQTFANAEYANLTTALEHALTTSQPIMSLVLCLDELLDQAHQNTARRTLLENALIYYTDPGNDPDPGREATMLHNLAGVLALQENRLPEARRHHEAELALNLRFNDEHNAARTYHQLGRVAQEQRDFPAALEYYRKALDLKLRFNDEHSAASTYHQLGMVAEEQRDFPAALEYYRKALDLKLRFNDEHSAAITYHQLGNVLVDQSRQTTAVGCFAAAAIYWRRSVGVWPAETIAALRKARSAMSDDQFNIALAGEVPAGEVVQELLDELNSPDTTS